MKFASVRKAVLAFVLPIVATAGAAMSDGSLEWREVVIAIGAGLVTGAAVYATPNASTNTQ